MSGEIQLVAPSKPTTAYFVVRNSAGLYWYTTTPAFEAYNAAHWANYAISLTQDGSSQHYAGTFPSSIGSGAYQITGYAQAGGSPAVTDVMIGYDERFQWSGSAIVSLDSRAKPADTIAAVTSVTNRVTANTDQINGNATAAANAAKFWAGSLLDSGTAQAGSSSTITLQSGASASDDYYLNSVVVITSGAGAGQNRRITGYVGATKVATVSGDRDWVTAPDNTSVYFIMGDIP